jgi:hypothetical protein
MKLSADIAPGVISCITFNAYVDHHNCLLVMGQHFSSYVISHLTFWPRLFVTVWYGTGNEAEIS